MASQYTSFHLIYSTALCSELIFAFAPCFIVDPCRVTNRPDLPPPYCHIKSPWMAAWIMALGMALEHQWLTLWNSWLSAAICNKSAACRLRVTSHISWTRFSPKRQQQLGLSLVKVDNESVAGFLDFKVRFLKVRKAHSLPFSILKFRAKWKVVRVLNLPLDNSTIDPMDCVKRT